MKNANTHPFTSFRLRLLAAGEWLLVLPATVFLAAAALRTMQPRQYQPARISWAIFEWADRHMTDLSATIFLIAMPVLAVIVGCLVLLKSWQRDQVLRQDVSTVFAIARRRLGVALLTTAILFGCGILLAVLVHIITD